MDKNYTRQFQKEILKLHLSIAAFSSVFILLLSFWLDYFYNGAVIDFIQMIFGWNVAFFILKTTALIYESKQTKQLSKPCVAI